MYIFKKYCISIIMLHYYCWDYIIFRKKWIEWNHCLVAQRIIIIIYWNWRIEHKKAMSVSLVYHCIHSSRKFNSILTWRLWGLLCFFYFIIFYVCWVLLGIANPCRCVGKSFSWVVSSCNIPPPPLDRRSWFTKVVSRTNTNTNKTRGVTRV